MPRLGSIVLASVLLGIPRALEARTFGARRSVYFELSPSTPELAAFGDALGRALADRRFSLAGRRTQETLVIDVLAVASGRDRRGRAQQAVSVAVRDPLGERRLVLHGDPADREGMARSLLDRLALVES